MEKMKKYLGLTFEPILIITLLILLCKIFSLAIFFKLKLTKEILLINTGLLLLLLTPAYCFSSGLRKIYLYIVNLFCTFLIITDLLYFRYFGTPANLYVFMQSANLTDLGPSILELMKRTDLLYFLDLVLLPFFFLFTAHRITPSRRLCCCTLLLSLLLTTYYPLYNYSQGVEFRRFTANDTLYAFGPLGFHFMDTAYFIKDRNIKLTPEIKTEIQDWFTIKQQQEKHKKTSPYQDLGNGKNLIVIQVESLQNFVIGKTIHGQEITPHLNKLLKSSLYFPYFYPQTIAGNSSDAELIMNTSLYPLQQGSTFFIHPHNQYDSLPLLLKEKGYQTLAVHADEANFWNRHQAYPVLGFDQYISIEKMEETEMIGMGLSDEAMFKQSVSFLQTTAQPFYAFIITLTNHYPYYIPADKAFLQLPAPLAQSHLGNYLQSVHYTDQTIGLFMEELEQTGLLENSLIAIYGDHDGLFKRDQAEIEKLFTHKTISEEEWIRNYVPVPLLLYQKGLTGKTFKTYGGQVDFLPTITHLMAIDSSKHPYAMGQNLLTTENDFALIPSGDYITQAARVTPEKVETTLSSFDQQTLKVADLIIKTNFCAQSKN